jgi:phage-related baseplate assembly protein
MSGTIDLSQLPPPVVVEPLDFETLFNERKEAFIALYPEDEQDVIRRTSRWNLSRSPCCWKKTATANYCYASA